MTLMLYYMNHYLYSYDYLLLIIILIFSNTDILYLFRNVLLSDPQPTLGLQNIPEYDSIGNETEL